MKEYIDYYFTYPVLLWLQVVLGVIIWHLVEILIEKKSPNKAFWLWFRIIAAAVIWWFLERHSRVPHYWSIPTYLFTGLLHDLILAKFLHGKWHYVNKTGNLDKMQTNSFGGSTTWVIFKAIAFLTTFIGYFWNNWEKMNW